MLNSDFTGGLRITGSPPVFPLFPLVNLNGHKVTVDQEGIEVNAKTNAYLFGGTLTSSEPFLDLRLLSQSGNNGYSYISVNAIISDSAHQVGLRIAGSDPGEGGVNLGGNQSNTFTGNVEVSGRRNHLVLNKENGAIAVRGNFLVKDRALVRFSRSNQTLGTSNITLESYGVFQKLSSDGSDITNTLKNLTIEDNGIVHFNHEEGNNANTKYYIYLDNLIINQGGHLGVQDWQDERDFLLVRKNSQNLADALTKMEFVGYDPANIHLRDFNSDYWEISGTPEPAAYGALFAAAGLGLWTWRKRHKRPH